MSRLLFLTLMLILSVDLQALSKDGRSLHRYATTERSYSANAYWIESAQGLVLIDALYLKPDAENLAVLLKSRKKPLLGIFLTHPHVDHFGGLGVLRKHFPEVPIYATQGTAENVQSVHDEAFAAGWIQAMGEDYDPKVTVPQHIVESGGRVELGDLHFRVRSFGSMEAADNALIYSEELDILFTGDAVLNGPIYYLGEGHSRGAIDGLEQISASYPATLRAYPAHGDPGELGAMLEHELAQVRYMREQVEQAIQRPSALTAEGTLSVPARARLLGLFSEHFRHYQAFGVGVETMVLMNLSGLEKEILAERAAQSAPGP